MTIAIPGVYLVQWWRALCLAHCPRVTRNCSSLACACRHSAECHRHRRCWQGRTPTRPYSCPRTAARSTTLMSRPSWSCCHLYNVTRIQTVNQLYRDTNSGTIKKYRKVDNSTYESLSLSRADCLLLDQALIAIQYTGLTGRAHGPRNTSKRNIVFSLLFILHALNVTHNLQTPQHNSLTDNADRLPANSHLFINWIVSYFTKV